MNNNEKQKIVFHKDMNVADVLNMHPYARNVLMGFGLHCFGCPISQMETLEDASYVHGFELDYLLQKLNEINEMDLSEFEANAQNASTQPFGWDDEF